MSFFDGLFGQALGVGVGTLGYNQQDFVQQMGAHAYAQQQVFLAQQARDKALREMAEARDSSINLVKQPDGSYAAPRQIEHAPESED